MKTNGYSERVLKKLRGLGYKITPQRISIIDYLESAGNHPSVDTIYADISKNFPTLSLATVYNTMDTLAEIGEIRHFHFDGNSKQYDPVTDPHHHQYCGKCGKVQDIFYEDWNQLLPPGNGDPRFTVTEVLVTMKGLCQSCDK